MNLYVRAFTQAVLFLCIVLRSTVFSTDRHSLTAAILSDFPPLYTTDKNGNASGLAIEISKHIESELGIPIVFLPVSNWSEAMEAIRNKKADFIPGIGISDTRKSEFLFTYEIETVPVSIFVRKSNSDIQELNHLTGHRVAVIKESAAESKLNDMYPQIKLIQFSSIESALFSLLAGNVDAFVFPRPVLEKKMSDIGVQKKIKVIGKPVIDLKRGFLFRKDDSLFVHELINPELKSLVESQKYLDLLQKWYEAPSNEWTFNRFIFFLSVIVILLGALFYTLWTITVQQINRNLKRSLEKQHTTEKALLESEERHRILFETSPYAIAVVSPENQNIKFVNATFNSMFGYSKQDIQHLHLKDLLPQEEYELAEQMIKNVLSRKVINNPSNKHTCFKKDRTQFNCEIVALPVSFRGKKSLVCFFSDITEKQKLLEIQRQSEKLISIGQLAGGIAHDFNNQLCGILGYCDIVLLSLPENEKIKNYIHKIISVVKRSSDLTSQLLAFARKGKYVEQVIDIHTVLHEVVSLVERTISKKIIISHTLDAKPSTVFGDHSQLQNALLNLTLNARDAMPDGGTIHYSTRIEDFDADKCSSLGNEINPGTYIRIDVSDTGCGIPMSDIDRIFEPFYSTKEPGKGTGMGLAAVYGTVKNHIGTLRVKSVVDEGTTISIFLPICDKKIEDNVPSEISSHVKKRDSYSILLVEDEDVVRNMTRIILSSAGYRVYQCCDGAEAVEYFKLHHKNIDIVFLDMVMPVMDGRETYNELQKIQNDVCVILSSGYSFNGAIPDILRKGIANFIQKPYTKKQLLKIIKETIEKFNTN